MAEKHLKNYKKIEKTIVSLANIISEYQSSFNDGTKLAWQRRYYFTCFLQECKVYLSKINNLEAAIINLSTNDSLNELAENAKKLQNK